MEKRSIDENYLRIISRESEPERTCRVEYSLDLSSEYDRVRMLLAHEMERLDDADDSDNSDERFDRAFRK